MKIKILTYLIFASSLLLTNSVDAQGPAQVILTWQANNFFPTNFSGKALATLGSPVEISAEVLRDGKLLDLLNANFTWLLDEAVLSRGDGVKETSFVVKKVVGDAHFVRVVIKSGKEVFENSVRIPVSEPVVIIDAPSSQKLVPREGGITLRSIPYFFNVGAFSDFIFSWQVNDQKQKGGNDNELILNVGTPQTESQKILNIVSTVQNKKNFLEFATERIKLKIY